MQFGMIGMQSARRGLNTPPTMEIRPGFLFNIMITKDMILPLWRGHPMGQKTAAREVSEETEGSGSYQQLY
jgi:type IV secretion system protein VirB10